ncbi:hypothetical protein N7510_007400 [Penicillium lagena]|uniref:uncharacterized protein n=1 Tax=Penicillium lagena TaxID=94218 RepID=UPI00253FBCFA|nr:uncharacterized protein N7510_007400 [Penicillium lagena]KAJ5610681.1 hypothetical protein N7510_007400 [Penicillium lagena]
MTALSSAMLMDQAMIMPQFQPSEAESSILGIAGELLDLLLALTKALSLKSQNTISSSVQREITPSTLAKQESIYRFCRGASLSTPSPSRSM